MADQATLAETQEGNDTGTASESELTLCIAWDAHQPELSGQTLEWPADLGRRGLVLGRGDAPPSTGDLRAHWVRQRPGRNEPGAALSNRRLSREQLRITRAAAGLRVQGIGRLPSSVNGKTATDPVLQFGDVLAVGHQLLLLVVERPSPLPSLLSATVQHPFGEPDAAGIVGESPVAWALRDRLAFIGARREHALVLGPSGSGKELAARALHLGSARRDGPLVARNAATIPESLIDAELFGNSRDYPNPGMAARPGLVGEADGGTLFLDELGELPESHQAHLLRLLDSGGEYHRLGEARARRSDLRLVSATNRDPGELKHDLLARLTLRVSIPGLDRRPEDIPLLTRHLLAAAAREDAALRGRFFERELPERPRVALDLLAGLLRHPYTHHVRELRALLWTAMASSPDDTLRLTDEVREALGDQASADPAALDQDTVRAALERHGWVKSKALRRAGPQQPVPAGEAHEEAGHHAARLRAATGPCTR